MNSLLCPLFFSMTPHPASQTHRRPTRWFGAIIPAMLGVAFATSALASNVSEARARYQSDRAACMSGNTNQSRDTCLKEAAAAFQEIKHGTIQSDDSRTYEDNQRKRCANVPIPDREDCQRRMNGEGMTTGNVEAGGIYRELERTLPMEPAK